MVVGVRGGTGRGGGVMTKLHDKVNPINPNYHGSQKLFYFGKAKISKGVNLWAGTWKRINEIDGKRLELEGRGFNLDEIDEVKLSREGLAKILGDM